MVPHRCMCLLQIQWHGITQVYVSVIDIMAWHGITQVYVSVTDTMAWYYTGVCVCYRYNGMVLHRCMVSRKCMCLLQTQWHVTTLVYVSAADAVTWYHTDVYVCCRHSDMVTYKCVPILQIRRHGTTDDCR